jgi:hypothetical protein
MSAGPTVSFQKIIAATKGNPSLREALTQMMQVSQQQQTVTGTAPQSGANPGNVNPSAPVPGQASGSVSQLGTSYVVELVNPGGTSPISQLQAAQRAGKSTSLTSLEPVTPIYHQIRASTSPAFNVNSNTRTFGGDSGQVQTHWTITELGSGTWYFQFRSTYDGINWNKWRNANGGSALGGLISQVTTETAGDTEWILFSLAGGLLMGIGSAVLHDQGVFNMASELYSSGMLAIAGPNGFDPNGNGVFGISKCDVDLVVPNPIPAGIPDYPVQIRMDYGSSVGGGYDSPGTANVFAIAFDPTNPNVKLYPGVNANWAVIRLPGGARIAIGQGKNNDGETVWTPGLPWMDSSRSMGIAALTGATGGSVIAGFQTGFTGFALTAKNVLPGGTTVPGTANWISIAWELGAPVQTVSGNHFLTIGLQGKHEVVIGCGKTHHGTSIVLPAGLSTAQRFSIGVPASTDATSNHLRGVQECTIFGVLPQLLYSDNSVFWNGDVGWLMALWK